MLAGSENDFFFNSKYFLPKSIFLSINIEHIFIANFGQSEIWFQSTGIFRTTWVHLVLSVLVLNSALLFQSSIDLMVSSFLKLANIHNRF